MHNDTVALYAKVRFSLFFYTSFISRVSFHREEESNETLCWLSRVDDFLVEQMGDYLKDCINQFTLDSNDTSYDVQTSGKCKVMHVGFRITYSSNAHQIK